MEARRRRVHPGRHGVRRHRRGPALHGDPASRRRGLSTDRAADLVRKLAKYAEAGLPRYWVFDPEEAELVVFMRADAGMFHEVGRYGPHEEADLDVGPARVRLRPSTLVD